MILFIQKLIIIPINIPKSGPPKATLTKLVRTPNMDEEFPLDRSRNSRKKTIAVPSFISDYPSTNVLNLTLAPKSLRRATTATGSVADNTQPMVSA